MDEAHLSEHAQDFLHVLTPERIVCLEGQFECRALDMCEKDLKIVWVDQRVFRRRVKKVRRMTDDELIEGRTRSHEDGCGATAAPAGPARSLPCRRYGARVTGHDGHIECPNVDAKLERVGRYHAAHAPFPQASFNLATPARQIAAPVAANDLIVGRRTAEIILEVGRQDLSRQTALREHDCLKVPAQELCCDTPGLR